MPTATQPSFAPAHLRRPSPTDQFIVLWRSTGRGLKTLFSTDSRSPLAATQDELASYSTTVLQDPDALEIDRRYLVRTQDARDWFGLPV